MKQICSFSLLTIMLLFLTNSCEEPVNLPAVITEITVSEITATTAKSGGTVTDDKGEEILERGICWSTTINPTVKDSVTYNGVGVGAFISILTNLIPNSTYYLRAYATNKSGTAYGNEISFKTLADLATINTTPVNLITTTTAKSGGNIINDGNSTVIERGVCWSTTINPTVSNNKTEDGEGIGSYVSLITNLSPGTKYYVRAYAKNEIGISYGNNESFTTEIELPTVSTNSVSVKTSTTALGGGRVIDDGGGSIISRGVCWSINKNPTIEFSNKTTDGNGSGVFSSNITNLVVGNTYYIRAYAENLAGTSYGNEITFIVIDIGSNYAGGVVFDLYPGRQHGLVCAPIDQSNGAQWYNAIEICNDLILNDFNDWYLPEIGELLLIYNNLHIKGICKLNDGGYWSSSETGKGSTTAQCISSDGRVFHNPKSWELKVRAIRKF